MLSNYLIENQISVYKLSKESNVPYTTLNELVRGERSINECSVKVLISLSNSLNLSLDELYKICVSQPKLSENLKPFFWDRDFKTLDIQKDKKYIISRLLDQGGFNGYKFIKNAYTYEEIKEVAKTSRNISPKTASFLLNCYNLKKEEMSFYKVRNHEWR